MAEFWKSATQIDDDPDARFWGDATPVEDRPWHGSQPVDDTESDFRLADTNHKVKFAKKRLAQSPLPEVFSALTQITFRGVSKVQRVTGFGDADESNRIADAFATASASMDERRPGPLKWVAPAIRGAAVSMPEQVVAGAVGGPPAMIGLAMAGEANQAITEGRDAGLEGADLAQYAASQGVIEGAPAYIMNKIGLGGFEGIFGKQASRVVSGGVMDGLKSFGVQTLAELFEENLTELGHNAARVVADVNEGAMDPENMWETVKQTSAQALAQMGVAGSGQAILGKAEAVQAGKYAEARREVVRMAEAGETPSRTEWLKKLGMPASEGKTAGQRRDILQNVAEQIRLQDAATEAAQEAPAGLGQEAIDEPPSIQELQPGPPAVAQQQLQAEMAPEAPQGPPSPPQEAAAATPVEGEISPVVDEKAFQLNRAASDIIREQIGKRNLAEPDRERWADLDSQVEQAGLDEQALDLAREVKLNPRQTTSLEHATMVKKGAKLMAQRRNEVQIQEDAEKRGDQDEYDASTAREEGLTEQLDLLTEVDAAAGTKSAQALSIRRMAIDSEEFSLISVMNRVRKAKGKGAKLSEKDLGDISRSTKAVEKIESEVEEIEQADRDSEEKREASAAQKVLNAEKPRKSVGKEIRKKAVAEREDIKKRIRQLGLRVNDITGLPAEGAYLFGRLGITYIKEGAGTLTEVIEKLRADAPQLNLTAQDVYKLLTMQNPASKKRVRSDAEKRVSRLTSMARMLGEINDIAAGKAPKKGVKREVIPEIKAIQKKLTAARNEFYYSDIEKARLESAIERLNGLQDRLKNGLKEAKKAKKAKRPVPPALAGVRDEISQVQEELRIDEELIKARRQLETGVAEVKEVPKPRKISERLQKKRIELKKAKDAIRLMIHESRPWSGIRVLGEVAATAKSFKATADISFTFRQNVVQVFAHPILSAKTFVPSWKAFMSTNASERIQDNIANSKNAFLYDKFGLAIMDAQSPDAREKSEVYRSSVVENLKVPGLKDPRWNVVGQIMKASSRHAVAVGNLIRTGAFDAFVEQNPNLTDVEMRAFASYLNISTGLGYLGKFGAAAAELNITFFSPRFAVSRVQTPFMVLRHYNLPRVRNQIARDMAGFVATGGTVLALAVMAGMEVGWDPEDSNWGKIRIGDHRIDIWGGFQQPSRVIARLATNPFRKDADWNPLELLGRFAAFKFAPIVTTPIELVRGKTAVGEETTRLSTMAHTLMPMTMEDIEDAWRSAGPLAGVGVGSLVSLGVSASTYEDSKTATRNRIKRLKRAKEYRAAETLLREWNKNNPNDRIVTVKLK